MSIKKAIADRRDIMRNDWMLKPFHISDVYNMDEPGPYEPLIYGNQYQEFYSKFVLNPLQNVKHRQVIAALWSTYAANRLGKGYGKSMLMAEESKRINIDFGASKLREFGVDEEDVIGNPFVAGYCTFKEAMEVKSFPAALLEGVGFILASSYGDLGTVHQELRRRICERIEAEDGYEGDSIRVALHRAIRQYRSLGVQLTHREKRPSSTTSVVTTHQNSSIAWLKSVRGSGRRKASISCISSMCFFSWPGLNTWCTSLTRSKISRNTLASRIRTSVFSGNRSARPLLRAKWRLSYSRCTLKRSTRAPSRSFSIT
jgi:hypothetical protein